MRRSLLIFCLLMCISTAFAQSCPQASTVYTTENGSVTPVAPPGWQISWKHKLDSSNVKFIYAAWAEQRIDPQDQEKVLCIYGNPDLSEHGLILISTQRVDIAQIRSRAAWRELDHEPGDAYFRCETPHPQDCTFD